MPNATSSVCDQGGNPQNLTRLLLRLDPDPSRASEKYQGIRCRLAKFFEWNHCTGPEDLADKVLDRVAAKLDSEEIREIDKYFFGVARFVCLEAQERMRREAHIEDLPGGENALPVGPDESAEIVKKLYEERRLDCLRQCLAKLMPDDRQLIIQFYSAEEEKQKTVRRKLAEKVGLKPGTLRVRASRLRAKLEQWVKRCLESRRQSPGSDS